MYKSPIEIFVEDTMKKFDEKMLEEAYTITLNYGISVDKGEMMRALKYDRQQYERGFTDGYERAKEEVKDAEPVRHGHWVKWDDEITYDCSICGDAFTLYEGTPESNHYNYCPNCGAKMDLEVSQ